MNLSPHFTLEEMTITQVRGVDNMPMPGGIPNLTKVCQTLEHVRTLLGGPIIVTSGFRSPEVNERVGGVPNSAHIYCNAADFICPAFGDPLMIVNAIDNTGSILFDQLIEEGTWVHLSIAPPLRGQVLRKVPGGYETMPRTSVTVPPTQV